jgi:hypothetical protein
MRFSHVRAAVSLALALCAGTASAATVDVSGFGTAGFVITDTDKAEFIRSSQPVGADSSGDVGVDSIAGVQATVHLTDRISGTTQVLVRRLYSDGFELDVPLAFIKAELNKNFAVRVGRVSLPVFLVSDFRQVGFANTWIRPPIEVYGQVPIDSVDGFDVLYSGEAGPITLSGQAFYGKADVDLSETSHVSVRDFWGINVSASYGPLTLRAGRVEDKLTLDSTQANSLLAGLRQAGFSAYADQLAVTDKKSVFTAFGALLDWHNVIVQVEDTSSKLGGFPADTSGRYALVGYRIHKVTPFAMYAEREIDSARSSTVIPSVGPLIPLAAGVNALIKGNEQNTTSLGLRWDAADSVAVKFQYDHVDPEGAGLFGNVKAGFDGPVNVFGIAVDVVF